jgi:hypothetical protein
LPDAPLRNSQVHYADTRIVQRLYLCRQWVRSPQNRTLPISTEARELALRSPCRGNSNGGRTLRAFQVRQRSELNCQLLCFLISAVVMRWLRKIIWSSCGS